MPCPVVLTGQDFLASALSHVDCQAQAVGAYGWGALASPGSPVMLAMTSLLTIFIALFGIRLLLGYPMAGRDVVADILKLGIVLTLATSWPAWRVVGYDLIINGPAQIAQAIGSGAGLPGSAGDLAARLQNLDRGFAAFNVYGSGRLGVAQGDWFQLGLARIAFLTGTLGPLALVRLLAGVLLAIGPLMAGLLLFGVTRGLFEGWLRALATTFLASIALSAVLGVELAILEPWMSDALQRRASQVATLDAPVEVVVASLSFAVICLATVFLIARLAFHSRLNFSVFTAQAQQTSETPRASVGTRSSQPQEEPARAVLVANAVTESLRREERIAGVARADQARERGFATNPAVAGVAGRGGSDALGSSWRRATPRATGAGRRRDGAQ